ncbi:MAG: protein kinase [Cyanomargarita calcarea GSE-NOS-MK-12-04C]|jgi:serine/threonine-protein kinase|uniref:non-specific serine/threonine protein kinase n=1 Tax=Cyanomargarita calcarea GSE-NOS-MK-12-04C TaxID=2839659 RepID=A0A951QWM0_9CYAN|nr:protein kinase [Cyanomargarita calcarea GSE-NOS-MK-12-04C]
MIGQLLAGHYKVLQVLGEGGFGQTYIVEDIHLPGKPQCVLKHLKPTSTDPEVLESSRRLFQKEAETLQYLGNHDQIPRLLAYFEQDQEFYLVQELILGHPLSKELPPGKKWTENQIVLMLIEVLSILEFVHTQGVIHRDIKPDNLIRRTSDRRLILIDFGAIKLIRKQTAIATAQHNITIAIGTPGYMPSEHTRRLPRPSSDIYAVGMMGIQALTGVSPRELKDDQNTGEILWQNLTDVSLELDAVLSKMTRYHFKDRYQSASEAIVALRELVNPDDIPPIEAVTTTSLHELTLEWVEAGQIVTRAILEKQQSNNFGGVRIGRDPETCDIVLSEATVSALHAEIFFNSQIKRFYLRNLRQRNPPIVDGQMLLAGEMPLAIGSNLRLGQQRLKVSDITLKNYPTEYTPREYATNDQMGQQPVVKTVLPPKISNFEQNIASYVPPTLSPFWSYSSKLLLLIGVGAAAVLSTVGGLVLSKTGNFGATRVERNSISPSVQLCRVIFPNDGNSVNLSLQPDSQAKKLKQLKTGDRVLFIKEEGDFAQVKLADGTQGWILRNQIQPCVLRPTPFPPKQ